MPERKSVLASDARVLYDPQHPFRPLNPGVRRLVMIVREYDRDADFEGIRACLIELQDFERRIDRRMPAGDEIANAYISEALSKCAECHGRIFVADQNGEIAGYATVLAKVRSGALDDGDLEYAYLADLVVRRRIEVVESDGS